MQNRDILKWFIQNFPLYVQQMRECSYHYDEKRLNLHHLEGDVWTHTVLSYQYAIEFDVPEHIKWAVVLHDIGRVFTKEKNREKKRLNFGDFEGVSCYVALEILNKTKLKDEQKIRILKIISYHYTMIDHVKFDDPNYEELLKQFKYEEELLYDLALYVKCDLNGRIIDESRQHLYDLTRIDSLLSKLEDIKKNEKKDINKKYNVYLLVGPPCSGKSSWIRNSNKEWIVVNRDSCVLEVGAKHDKHSYDEAFDLMHENKDVKKEINKVDSQKEDFAKNSSNTDVVIDNPNLKIKNRKEWIDALGDTHNIIVVQFLTPFEDLVKRSTNRKKVENKFISKNGMIRKLKTFYFPLKSEGIDKVEYILT